MPSMNKPAHPEPLSLYFEHIAAYLAWLERTYALSISIHMRGRFLWHYPELGEFRTHRVPYCMAIKSSLALSLCCQRCQRMVVASLCADPTPRFGTCVFGVEEFTLPISQNSSIIGFISVTGYSSDPARTRAIAHRRFDQLGIDSPPDIGPGLARLKSSLPDPELLTTLLTPIADLLGVTLIRETRPQRSGSYNYTCAYIMEYIELHYDEDLSAGLLAEAAHCSVSYINHMFKKNVGVSLSRFIAEVRIRRAKKLLDDRRASIKSVAVSVGYSDTNYFSAVFRRITGLTPSEWRRCRRR